MGQAQEQEGRVCGGWFIKAAGGALSSGNVPCKRWDCDRETCAPAKAKYYYALLCNGLGVAGGGNEAANTAQLMTLTTDPKKWGSRAEAWEAMGRTWQKMRQRIRYHYGAFEFACVTEATKAGWPHLHVIVRGLGNVEAGWREEVVDAGEWRAMTEADVKEPGKWRIVREKRGANGKPTLSAMADGAGFGEVVDLREIRASNDKGAVNYLYKYLLKGAEEGNDWYPPNYRRVRYSSGWLSDAWEKPEPSPVGVGLFLAHKDTAAFVRHYIEQGMSLGFAPEGIVDGIQKRGVEEWLKDRATEFERWLCR